MPSLEDYKGQIPAWCPGCGNFGMLKAFKQALAEMEIKPEEIAIVSGIGQSGKFPHYLKCNMINGIHGRTLPVATGIRLANHGLKVVAVAGDGDCYGEGGNHLLAALRKNPDLTDLVKLIGADGPRRIVHVSCNPATLARDAEVLVAVHGYTLRAAGIVNMFPHTAHVESIALFDRN